MIGYLEGKIISVQKNNLIILVNGVGYRVFVSERISSKLTINDVSSFFIYTHVKEDQLSLFGFKTEAELTLFEMLLSVSGIGPRSASLIISAAGAEKILASIRKADIDFFMEIPGLGKKTAQKIIVDLQSKVGKISELDLDQGENTDLEEALMNMAFSKQEAKHMAKGINKDLPLKDKLKLSLKVKK